MFVRSKIGKKRDQQQQVWVDKKRRLFIHLYDSSQFDTRAAMLCPILSLFAFMGTAGCSIVCVFVCVFVHPVAGDALKHHCLVAWQQPP